MTLAGKTDYLSQLISDSERFVTTIDLTDGRVLTKDLADLKNTAFEDPDIIEAYRKGSNPEVVHRSYEAAAAITVRRRSSLPSSHQPRQSDVAVLSAIPLWNGNRFPARRAWRPARTTF
jgi:hypothetical protein